MKVRFDRQRGAVSRSLLLSVPVLLVAVALLGWWMTRPGPLASAADDPTHHVVQFHDYSFAPSHMTWHVGDTVTLTFVNRSEAHPGKAHEFMLGHDPRSHATMLGTAQQDGFRHDFFTGVTVHFGNARGVEMLMPGKARVLGKQAPKYFMRMSQGGMQDDQSMAGTDDGGDSMKGMSGDDDSMKQMDADKDTSGSSMKGMVMRGNGLMVTLKPGGTAAIRFTVPDRPGEWTYGCFEQSGQHFLNGMRGTVTIVE